MLVALILGHPVLFYCTRLLYCPDQMLAGIPLIHDQALSSKTVMPRVPYGTDI